MKYDKLFSPIKINQLMVKNRIVAAPVGDTFEDKALGGAGIVIAGHAIVQYGKSSFASGDEPDIFSKYEIENTVSRVRRIHMGGAKASIEIFHGGLYARVLDHAYGPQDDIREDGVVIKGLDDDSMQEVLNCYATTAKNAKEAGFDMIFMHFGHGWLPAQFLSPLFNKRDDEYGGSFENRARFPLEILKAVRAAVGKDYPIDMRISAYEWVEGSIDFEDVKEFIKLAQKYIDTVQISAGLDINHEGNVHMATTNFEEHMPNVHWAQQIKECVEIPVSVVGAVLSAREANEVISQGKVDMVAFGRAFIADPYWPRKILENREEDVVPCLRCLQCYHIATNRKNVGCSVNPRYTNEEFIPKNVEPAKTVKNVAIIGGGPAGMQAAITASKRGHKVILFEKNDHLGGQIANVAKEHYKEDVRRFYHYLIGQVGKSNIDIRLNEEATPEKLRNLGLDTIVIAVGASQIIPPINGIDSERVIDAISAIRKPENIGDNVIVIGGGTIGAEIGLELSLIENKTVNIIEIGNELAPQGNLLYKIALNQKVRQAKTLTVNLNARCQEITKNSVVMEKGGRIQEILYDTVIYSTGLRANRELAQSFYGITPDVAVIGDCVAPRKIMEAIYEGHSFALNI